MGEQNSAVLPAASHRGVGDGESEIALQPQASAHDPAAHEGASVRVAQTDGKRNVFRARVQLARDARALEHPHVQRVVQVDAEVQTQIQTALRPQIGPAGQLEPGTGQPETDRQRVGETGLKLQVETQDPRGAVSDQLQFQQIAGLGDVERRFQFLLQELDRGRRVGRDLVQGIGELVRVGQHVVDADVDQRDRFVQEFKRLEAVEEIDQRPQRREDFRKADVLEVSQVIEPGVRDFDIRLLAGKRIADVVDRHRHRRRRSRLDQTERRLDVHAERQTAAAVHLGRFDQRADVAQAVDQLLERDLAVRIVLIGIR